MTDAASDGFNEGAEFSNKVLSCAKKFDKVTCNARKVACPEEDVEKYKRELMSLTRLDVWVKCAKGGQS